MDTGVAGTETLIEEYLKSINRKMTDIKGVFLTHSHPDHAGAAAEIKRKSMCEIYAPCQEVSWIEDIQKQYNERPIPNFFKLLYESVKVDRPLTDAEKTNEILKRADMLMYAGNPLVIKSIEACKNACE